MTVILRASILSLVFFITPLFSLHAAIGETWTEATSSAAWSGRSAFGSLVFDNKMWVMGGTTGSGHVNDVWYSTDGVTWTQATASAAWTARMEMTTLVFDNKMWVLGGYDGAKKEDVWYSTDGVTWTQATASAAWGARSNHTSVVFDNKMWVMGGFLDASSSEENDVWYSTDGVTWTQATASAGWTNRERATSVVFDNKMWVIGGVGMSSQNDVWYSTDGVTWTQATSSAEWADRYSAASVVFDSKMWVLGGQASGRVNDVWYSTDGVTWTQATSSAEWEERREAQALVFNSKMWVLGGTTGSGHVNDVWYASSASYNLSFDSQGGSSVSSQQNNAPGDSLTLPSAPTRSGYRFLNWNTSSAGSGTSYSAGTSFSMPASHTTLYAIWQMQVGAAIPWCSGPMAPGWDSNKLDGGCGVTGLALTPPAITIAPKQQSAVQIFAMPVRDLRYGMTGEDVKTLQEFLVARGYGISAGITGSFYRQTQAALANYQMDHGIKPAAGYYGSVTRAQIQALLAE